MDGIVGIVGGRPQRALCPWFLRARQDPRVGVVGEEDRLGRSEASLRAPAGRISRSMRRERAREPQRFAVREPIERRNT